MQTINKEVIKRNQIEILVLKSIITNMKKIIRRTQQLIWAGRRISELCKGNYQVQEKERKKNEDKWTEPQRPVGHHKSCQYRQNRGPLQERAERLLEEIIAQTPQIWWKTLIYTSKKFNKFQMELKEIHTSTYNQTVQNQRQTENLESSKGDVTLCTKDPW